MIRTGIVIACLPLCILAQQPPNRGKGPAATELTESPYFGAALQKVIAARTSEEALRSFLGPRRPSSGKGSFPEDHNYPSYHPNVSLPGLACIIVDYDQSRKGAEAIKTSAKLAYECALNHEGDYYKMDRAYMRLVERVAMITQLPYKEWQEESFYLIHETNPLSGQYRKDRMTVFANRQSESADPVGTYVVVRLEGAPTGWQVTVKIAGAWPN